eukprot:TRINITY_DN1795_c0_g1_i1.p1 TRINITY_DN1795_c0_g1~~TRINITY_DN1795_c0_g1_i1.p1  ORF type:complete len:147 (-),score=38.42 TRINITY_DN1795_c0_g1_i1:46-486(-)
MMENMIQNSIRGGPISKDGKWIPKVRSLRGEGAMGDKRPERAGRENREGLYNAPRRNRREDSSCSIRITNLSEEDTTEEALLSRFSPFGRIQRHYLSRDKNGLCRGFAFIHYYDERAAEAAIEAMNGTGWNYRIMVVEMAKPSRDR